MDINCRNCKLGKGCAIPGYGPDHVRLMVVSDYPGKVDFKYGIPMMGDPGQLLRRAIVNLLDLDAEKDVFYTNVLRCSPINEKGEADFGEAELVACKRWTAEEMKRVTADVILLAGDNAFETLLPQQYEAEKAADKKFNLSKAHGNVYQYMGNTYLVTWSPGYVLKNSFKDPRKSTKAGRRVEYENWYPTGSVPWFFIKDMTKLKELLDEIQKERNNADSDKAGLPG